MWKQVIVDDTVGVSKVASLVHPVDSRSLRLSAADLEALLNIGNTEAWLCSAGNFEIASVFHLPSNATNWQLSYIGCGGSASLGPIVGQLSQRIGAFLQSKHLSVLGMTHAEPTSAVAQLQTGLAASPLLKLKTVTTNDGEESYEITCLGPPGGNVATVSQWLHVSSEDPDLVKRFLNVMYQMGDRYQRETPELFNSWIGHSKEEFGGAYYLWQPTAQVVVRFVYNPLRKQFEILSVGLVGDIEPERALDLVVDKAVQYLGRLGHTSAYARRPKQMHAAAVMRLHDLVPSHPRLKVSIERDVPVAVRWNIEFPELFGIDINAAHTGQNVAC